MSVLDEIAAERPGSVHCMWTTVLLIKVPVDFTALALTFRLLMEHPD